MKIFRFLAAMLAAAALLALFLPASAAAAESDGEGAGSEAPSYARIEQDGVYLYRSPSAEAGLFVLPRSYFVRLAGEAGDYYAVEYLTGTQGRTAVRGYCLRDQVSPVDTSRPFPISVTRWT